jgi:hypothetical protein
MKIQVTMMNETTLALDEKTNELMGVVRFQATLPIEKFQELVNKVSKQKDGNFEITLE